MLDAIDSNPDVFSSTMTMNVLSSGTSDIIEDSVSSISGISSVAVIANNYVLQSYSYTIL